MKLRILAGLLCLSALTFADETPAPAAAADEHVHKFGDQTEMKDEAHIKQHFENKIDVEAMTEEQRRFHYFSMHDLDKDGKIDGIEIMKSLTHSHEGDQGAGTPISDEDAMIRMIDSVLEQMDINGDGYIDFAEYMKVGN